MIEQIPDKNNKNVFIFTAKDKATKWLKAAVIKNKTSQEVTKCIKEFVVNHARSLERLCLHKIILENFKLKTRN